MKNKKFNRRLLTFAFPTQNLPKTNASDSDYSKESDHSNESNHSNEPDHTNAESHDATLPAYTELREGKEMGKKNLTSLKNCKRNPGSIEIIAECNQCKYILFL